MKKLIYFSLFFLLAWVPADLSAQLANDACINATNLDSLPMPVACAPASTTGFNQGATTTLPSETNVGATSSAPYPFLSTCPINISSPPKDVWYSFIATGYQATITVSNATGTLTNPSITLWEGSCANLEGMGCSTGSGGAATLTVYQTVIGRTYYIQIAGADSTQTGTFTLTAACANNCAGCLLQSYITATPEPVNGSFNPGQAVMFCYTVTKWDEGNANWLHGVTVTYGTGWDSTTLVVDSVPPSCTATPGAFWAYYPGGQTSSATHTYWGPGFYYETSAGRNTGTPPGNNYGDQQAAQTTCDPNFCLSLTARPGCSPGSDLSVHFYPSGDGESGSWGSRACAIDPTVSLFSVGSCCPPVMGHISASCNQSNGVDTATPVGNAGPYLFQWSNGVTQTVNGPSVITGLAPGIYYVTVTNALNCVSTALDTIGAGARPYGGGTKYVSCPRVIDSVVMTAVGSGTWTALSTNPATTTIADPTSPSTSISGFTTLGIYRYVWTIACASDTVSVIVSSHPNGGPDVYTCVNGTARMAATGTGTWVTLPGNPAPTVITNPTANNTTITGFTVSGTYKYVWYVGICYDTVSVIVPNFVSSAAIADSVLCKYQTTHLTSTAGPSSLGPFTYIWLDSADVVSPHSASTATQPVLAPTHYVLRVSNAGGCVLYDTVSVALTGSAPRITLSASNNNVCPGDTVTLSGLVFAESLVTCGLVDTCVSNNLLFDIAVSSDTSTSTGGQFGFTSVYGSPFMGRYSSYKVQYLFTRAELNAAGLSSGSITDISFFVKQINSTAAYDTLSISMGCTGEDSLTHFFNNLQEVVPPQYGPNAVYPNLGWTPFPFTHYYNWDGSSNIVIQVCYTINPTLNSNDDFVSYSTTSYNGSSITAGDFSFFGSPPNGCSLDNTANFYQINRTRANVKFGMCAPNVLTYRWTPPTLLCDTCPTTRVVVSRDSTYTLTVNEGGCLNDSTIRVRINPYLAVSTTPDTTICFGDTLRLHEDLIHPAPSQCVQGYSVASIPFAPLNSSTPTAVPPADYMNAFGNSYSTDNGTAGPYPVGFTFPFYCQTYNQFYVNSNGWLTFQYPYPATTVAQEYTAQTFPPSAADMNPQKVIELMMGNYFLSNGFGGGGGSIDYFVTGAAPARTLVVQFNSMKDISGSYSTTGEMHLHETSGIIDVLIAFSTYITTDHTTGVKDSTGLGTAAPNRNNQPYTISIPEAWSFTPVYAPDVSFGSLLWSPNLYLSNDTISDPVTSTPGSQTYYVNGSVEINKYTHPELCPVHDSVRINIDTFRHILTASQLLVCPGDTVQLRFAPHSDTTIVSYSWVKPFGLSSAVVDSPFATVLGTTTYHITAIDGFGCRVVDSITINTVPTQHPQIAPDSAICYSDSVLLRLTGAYTNYQWYRIDTTTGARVLVSSGAADSIYYAHPTASYILEVRSAGAQCAAFTNIVSIDSFPKLPLLIDTFGSLRFCYGGHVILEAQQGLTNIQWTPSSYGSQASFPVTSSGTFYYGARDQYGCLLHSDTVQVVSSPIPAFILNTVKNPICVTDIDTLVAVSSPAGAAITWAGQAAGDTLIITAPGTFSLHADLSGCVNDTTIIISGAPSPAVTLPADTSECSCTPASPVIATATGGTPGYSFHWSNGGTGPSTIDSLLGSHSYSVTVTDFNQCTAQSNAQTITMSCPMVSISVIPVTDTIFLHDTATLTATAATGANYGYIWSSDSATVLSPDGSITGVIGQSVGVDTVRLLVTDKNTGCPYLAITTINVIEFGAFKMPTAFTPNGDQRNDNFYPVFNGPNSPAHVVTMRIYNRWGQLVYDNPNPPGWNGSFGGNQQSSETYMYFVTVAYPDPNDASRTIQRSVEGSFQLLR